MEPVLIVDNLVKKYAGTTSNAVDGISFEVRAGECFGLLGPNGAGKSTAIHCLTGLYPPTKGRVLIEGHESYSDPKHARQHLGFCSQDDSLDTDFAVLDQMVRHASFFRIPATEGRKYAMELLERFGLASRAKSPVESLSGGMRRRLQVARALVSRPKVVVLDEPTTGIDPEARRLLWEILVDFRAKGLAILLSTHYMDEAERLCDRIAILDNGRILDIAPPRALIEKYLAQKEIEEEIRPGVKWRRPANLEDVFLKLTGSRLGAGEARDPIEGANS